MEGKPKAVVHISHGMAEHSTRYARLAEALTGAGYAVYANDHRGHGKTAATSAELGTFDGGLNRVLLDLVELIAFEKSEHPGLPLVLLGHSMGSFFAQSLMQSHGAQFAGVVLSGTAGKPNALASVGRYLARFERVRLGPTGKSALIRSLAFDAFNKSFTPKVTGFEWLSRDAAEVEKYTKDPLCGFECSIECGVGRDEKIAQVLVGFRPLRVVHDVSGADAGGGALLSSSTSIRFT